MRRVKTRLVTALYARFPALARRWLRRHPMPVATDVPWTEASVPLEQARLGLVTTAGVHLRSQQAFDMRNPHGDPSHRVLPTDATPADLTITHDYYDTRAARHDLNVVYPVERLRELVAAGRLGNLTEANVALMGHVEESQLPALTRQTAPEVARLMRDQRADIVLLVPA